MTHPNISPARPTANRPRGTVMIETVLVLPFVVFILFLLFYFGRAVVRVQHGQEMARYEAWRAAGYAPGPTGGSARAMNTTFFGGAATGVGQGGAAWPDDASQALVDAAGRKSADAAQLAQTMVDQMDKGQGAEFTTWHDNDLALWNRLERPIKQRHVRLGNPWAHANGYRLIEGHSWSDFLYDGSVQAWPPDNSVWGDAWMPWEAMPLWRPTGPNAANDASVRDVFLTTLDQALESQAKQGGNPLAATLRRTYLGQPGYAGPSVQFR